MGYIVFYYLRHHVFSYRLRINMKVVIYSTDTGALTILKALLDSKAEVVLPEATELELGHLVLIDHSFPHSQKILDRVRQADDGIVIAVMSYNPFAIAQFMPYNIDAFVSKPLQVETIQALIIGVEARGGSLSA